MYCDELFIFDYLSFEDNKNKNESTIAFNNLLNKHTESKFLTYDLYNNINIYKNQIKPNNLSQIINAVICFENSCLIIEHIQYSYFNNLIDQVKQNRINDHETKEEEQAKIYNILNKIISFSSIQSSTSKIKWLVLNTGS